MTQVSPVNAVMLEAGKNIDSANITHAYYNRSFTPPNGKVQSAYTVMKIEKKERAPTDMRRWLVNDTAMVFCDEQFLPISDCAFTVQDPGASLLGNLSILLPALRAGEVL